MTCLLKNTFRFLMVAVLVLGASTLFAKTNVILMIVDGGGEGAYRIGSQNRTGEDRGLPFMKHEDGWKEFGCTTYSFSGMVRNSGSEMAGKATADYSEDGSYNPDTHWKDFETHMKNPTDSAASATALNTGYKTNNGRISMDTKGKKLETTAEFAVKNGFVAGAITTVMPSHATPAAVAAHNMNRGDGMNLWREMAKGNVLSVVMGACHPWYDESGERRNKPKFDKYGPSEHAWGEITTKELYYGWKFIEKREDFQNIASGKVAPPKKLMGLPQVSNTFQSSRSSKKEGRNENVPTLAECCMAGIQVLNQNEKGFYLMVESGSVDWIHKNPKRCCEEMNEFFDAVEAICAWVEKNSSWEETTLILTADHETFAIYGPNANKKETLFRTPIGKGKGEVPECEYFRNGHTNAPVPFFVKGQGAEEIAKRVRCTDETFGKIWGFKGEIIDNTDVAPVAMKLFGAP